MIFHPVSQVYILLFTDRSLGKFFLYGMEKIICQDKIFHVWTKEKFCDIAFMCEKNETMRCISA